jgi:phenylpropionate dioxygenase-like ring-hydroxylating dioxygenase large terminal subunit
MTVASMQFLLPTVNSDITLYDHSKYRHRLNTSCEDWTAVLNDPVLTKDWHVVARSEDIREGELSAVRLLGKDLVLWRSNGEVKAWQDLCIHRGTRLSLGRIIDDKLMCQYHGWTYDREGYCVHIPAHPEQKPPAKAKIETYRAEERYDFVWICLGDPTKDIPEFPEWDDSSYTKIFCGPYRYKASGPRAIENFLDVAHLPFVHEGLLGDPRHPEIVDYEPIIEPTGVTAKAIAVWQPNPDGTGKSSVVSYTYRVLRPLTAYLAKEGVENRYSLLLTVTPVDEIESIGWMMIAVNYAHDQVDQLRSFQNKIVSQDIPVVESQRPELLPLDLQAELHLRSDRMSIAYRKWLRELGLTFGTT